jgi:hypothetical protein
MFEGGVSGFGDDEVDSLREAQNERVKKREEFGKKGNAPNYLSSRRRTYLQGV